MNVETIVKRKGATVATIRPDATIADAASILRQKEIGAVVVSENGRQVDGILSERDIVHALAEQGAALLSMTVSSLMTRRVYTCSLDDNMADLARLMTDRRIRHLPVVEAGDLRGIVSIGDVVKNRLDEVEHEASSLREFIVNA
jgi:CBS domain-containing protein